jgi:outer membrane lipoprotein-sorting protein
LVLLVLLAFALPALAAPATPANSLLAAWLGGQTNLHTWSADCIQTRAFKSLAQPLTATGHVWFAEPNRFRWELGRPPQTIAVREAKEMLVIYPKLKRVERYPLGGEQAGPWRDALALLEAGFPRSPAQLESSFRILSENIDKQTDEVALQPKSSSARKMMPQIKITFDTRDFSLRATELQFADGSTMRNDFFNSVMNPKLNQEIFAPKIESDFKVIEPMKSSK